MKYECLDCHKVFVHSAVLASGAFALLVKADKKPEAVTLEFHVCPYCFSKNIDEIALSAKRIESIQSVKINEADALLKQGYDVKDTYASSVTLVKYVVEKPAEEEKKPTLQESQAEQDKDSEQLRKDLKSFNEPLGKEKA